jgi:HD-GYP domain-containing protein (c-di-GMP phosphodiesterase class II)
MLKRIIVIGSDEDALQQVRSAAGSEEDVWVELRGEDGPLPPAAGVVIAAAGSLETQAKRALQYAQREEELVELLGAAIDAREEYVQGAAHRVGAHATRFALAAGLAPDDRSVLERAALVRNMGNLRVPRKLLLKKTVFSEPEWRLVQAHTELGAEAAAETDTLADTAAVIRSHHEFYDGSGYPDGLVGEDIPELARMLTIIDVYCAMTSPRHYRQGRASHEDAVDYVKSEAGQLFDPRLVELFASREVGRPWMDAAVL